MVLLGVVLGVGVDDVLGLVGIVCIEYGVGDCFVVGVGCVGVFELGCEG